MKQQFEVDVDVSQPAVVLKTQLFTLTNVPVERQKIIGLKGGPLKDDADLAALGIKEGQKLVMMGTADAVPVAPANQVFLEDMPEAEREATEAGMVRDPPPPRPPHHAWVRRRAARRRLRSALRADPRRARPTCRRTTRPAS